MRASDLGLSGPVGSIVTVAGPSGALDLSTLTGTGGIVISVGQQFITVDGSGITGGGGSGSVTTASVVTANGFAGTVANPTTTPAITICTTATGILKGNGTAIAAATAGTDYQAPISLTTTGSSGAATFNGITLNIPQYSGGGGSGTVTTASIVSANGFGGTVANPTTTPAFTITTSVSGLLKGNGTGVSAATAGTDYQAPITLTTTGSSGAATFSAGTLNIPQYPGGGSVGPGTTGQLAVFTGSNTIGSATAGVEIDQSYGAIFATTAGGGTVNLNLSANSQFTVTLTGNITVAFSGGNVGQRFFIEYIQGGSGSYTVTYSNTVKWANKTQPALTATVGGIDLLSFYCPASATYHGGVAFPNLG